jgi:hypothetical protein
MQSRMKWLLLAVAISSPVRAADNPRRIDSGPGITAVKSLEQNWSDDVANWFYNVPQGSRLLPYDWFIHLEQANSQEPFRNANHIRALGYVPRTPGPGNPDGLPIGFVKDAPYEDGTAGLGLTCAACHTSQFTHSGTAYLIDGGPTMGNVGRLLTELAEALKATATDNAKFDRLAASVLPAGSSAGAKVALRAAIRTVSDARDGYNDRNLPTVGKPPFGPGRVDAFGAILNEVSVTLLGIPENLRPASAPVSFPCLWDAPQHDRVQWNGVAENKVSPLGNILFGTAELGALGRNSGEVLGVFGSATINAHELLIPRPYESTINKANLIQIEQSLKSLWSPLWPQDILGRFDTTRQTRGAILYAQNCARCHNPINRTDENRKVIAHMSDEGTDQNVIRNFGVVVATGRLRGRQSTLLGLERMGEHEPRGVILKHIVERVMLDPSLSLHTLQQTLATVAAESRGSHDGLNPGFRMKGTIKVGDKTLTGSFDSVSEDKEKSSVTVGGGHFELLDKTANDIAKNVDKVLVDLRTRAGVMQAAAGRLRGIITSKATNVDASAGEQSKVTLSNATVTIGYKARPLNGIWATAPYLHNGSVPNLAEMLKPSADRVKCFHVGSQVYDPVNVGFTDDPNQPLFDTTADGNSNAGHEYGGKLSVDQRRDLLEYLKSL